LKPRRVASSSFCLTSEHTKRRREGASPPPPSGPPGIFLDNLYSHFTQLCIFVAQFVRNAVESPSKSQKRLGRNLKNILIFWCIKNCLGTPKAFTLFAIRMNSCHVTLFLGALSSYLPKSSEKLLGVQVTS
jgi:hypothetical protein